jgi:hypothetical protein
VVVGILMRIHLPRSVLECGSEACVATALD